VTQGESPQRALTEEQQRHTPKDRALLASFLKRFSCFLHFSAPCPFRRTPPQTFMRWLLGKSWAVYRIYIEPVVASPVPVENLAVSYMKSWCKITKTEFPGDYTLD
jgi:hypothetical protein